MLCRDVTEHLYLFVCDELDDSASRSVTHHLAACPDCRKALAETVKLAGILGASLPKIPPRFYSVGN